MRTHCEKPGHELPTIGPKCAQCEHEAEVKARREARNAPQRAFLLQMRAELIRDMGLTPDSSKTPEWHAASRAYNVAFAALRNFNTSYVKQFKKQIAAAQVARRAR